MQRYRSKSTVRILSIEGVCTTLTIRGKDVSISWEHLIHQDVKLVLRSLSYQLVLCTYTHLLVVKELLVILDELRWLL